MNDCIANELTSTSARGSIHGHIHWDNGRHTDFIYARIVNGEERKADFIEFDGERYERVRTCVTEWDGKWLCCGACGECLGRFGVRTTSLLDGTKVRTLAEPVNYCPNCGAKVVGE